VAFKLNGQLQQIPARADSIAAALMLLYADDLVLLADSEAALAAALAELEAAAAEWGMCINYSKTKAVVFGARQPQQQHEQQQPQQPAAAIQLARGQVAYEDSFAYLGSVVQASGQQEAEMSRRLRLAGAAFSKLWPRVFSVRGISLGTKLRIYKAIVVPTLLYGAAESWAPTQAQLARLDAFHTSCLRRMLGAGRRHPGMISNQEVYAATGQPAISELLRVHRLRWLGHAARLPDGSAVKQLLFATGPGLAQLPAADRQRRVQGAPAMTWTKVVCEDLGTVGIDVRSWYEVCQDRPAWRERIALNSNRGTVG